MATTSRGRSPAFPLLMQRSLSPRLLSLLLLVHIVVIFTFVILNCVTCIIVGSFMSVVMYHFFGEANTCMFTISVLHIVVYGLRVIICKGCSIITSGCLALVMLLLWEENAYKLKVRDRSVIYAVYCKYCYHNLFKFDYDKQSCNKRGTDSTF